MTLLAHHSGGTGLQLSVILSDALDSILAQTRPCDEIVVDDESTDATGEIARSYEGVTYVRQRSRAGSR